MPISFRQLTAFRAVIENQSVTGAAAALRLSQPALSKLISNLETQTGLSLFRRVRRRLQPTPEAMIFYDNVVQVFSGLSNLEQLAKDLGSLEKGRLCVVAVQALGRDFLPDCIVEMSEQHADANFIFRTQSELLVADWIISKQADIGLTMLRTDHPELATQILGHVPASCVLPLGHKLARHKIIRPEHLRSERFVSFAEDVQTRALIDSVFARSKIERRIQLEAYSSEAACAFVARGAGLAIVDPFTANLFHRRGELVARPFEPQVPYTVRLIQPRRRPRSMMCDRFIDMLKPRFDAYLLAQGIPRMERGSRG
jgi:DNA-binding transcriptional LysR family regulator